MKDVSDLAKANSTENFSMTMYTIIYIIWVYRNMGL